MYIEVDRQQAQVLREVLQSALKELRIESARADSHDFRIALHQRERLLEGLLAQLESERRPSA